MAFLKLVLACIVALLALQQQANSQSLKTDFYKNSCPSVELIVKRTTDIYLSRIPSLAAAMLRLHFHDCFIRGCDGSVLISSTTNSTAEKDSFVNKSLRGFYLIDAVKSAVEKKCPGVVSCADILALVTRDAILHINGPFWPVPLGRRDGRVSIANEALFGLPPPFGNATVLIASFASKKLTVKDLVVLSGAHTIGFSQCSTITSRLYNFTGVGDTDPTLDPTYVKELKKKCSPTDRTSIIPMDPKSFQSFDVNYYTNVLKKRGLFQADATLLTNNVTNAYVATHSSSSGMSSFFKDFAASMVKMGNIEVLTGTAGEIRRVCSVIN